MGFDEVDLNLGCPSGTVTSKHRGSGCWPLRMSWTDFWTAYFPALHMAISVKTRLGFSSPEEFAAILENYNRYPICKAYRPPQSAGGHVQRRTRNLDAFRLAYEGSRAPVCYNGDIFSRGGMAVAFRIS
jgi:tRNA-dihydrouridine synthase